MWIGACTSSIGTWMQNVAQSWLVLNLSNSPFLLGLDAFLGGIPIFLFSLIGGVVADRIERRKVLLVSQCVQMGCAFLLTVLIAFHLVRVWQILCPVVRHGFRPGIRRTGLSGADSHAGRVRKTCRTPSPCNPFSSMWRA